MSFQLRPYQPQQDSAQEDQQQQGQQQPGAIYGTYSIHGTDPIPQQQPQYPQYPGPYQWQAAGYLTNGYVAEQTYYGPPYPPPPQSPFGDENAGNYYAGVTAVPSSGYPHFLATTSQPNAAPRVICGIKRNYCFILLAIVSFVLVLGIALGVGLGLTMNHSSGSDAATAPPAPTFTGTLVLAPVTCPHDNGTVYLSSPSSPTSASKPFNIECGRDYNSNDGTKDIGKSHKDVATMADCLDLCGANDECVGVGYGDYENSMTCWLKSQLGQPNSSPSWYAARLQDVD
ncbi:hypothetical protein SLS62_002593 [Diatrype stigma]|uniref:Apple domain-containing protein n=1 Tax=Diatrype stigma TaxID=117547 RepID=A0AAN9UWW3_9PEZI